MMTQKEKMVMDEILNQASEINSDRIDISKSYEENCEQWESGMYFWTEASYGAYGCGLDKHVFAGVLSSLQSKGFITCGFDQWWGGSCREMFIYKDNFIALQKEYGRA